jgi:peptide/nickel transport system substrate-binding protein
MDYINDPNVNSWKKSSDWEVGGKPTQLEAMDDYTLKFTFPVAKPVAKFYLMDEWDFDIMPAHLLKPLHPKYNQEMDYKEFENALPPDAVPIPTMGPWVPVEYKDRRVADNAAQPVLLEGRRRRQATAVP